MRVFVSILAIAAILVRQQSCVAVHLPVKSISGYVTQVDIEDDATVGDLKNKVAAANGIAADQLRLIFAGRLLEDARTVASYDMDDNSILHLVVRAKHRTSIQVLVRNSEGKQLTLDVERGETVKALKQKLNALEHVPEEHLGLALDNEILLDGKTLEDYGIEEAALLYQLNHLGEEAYQLLVHIPDRPAIILDVNMGDSVLSLKQKLSAKTNIPVAQQRLLLGRKPLLDSRTLTDYRLETTPVLRLVISERGESFYAGVFTWYYKLVRVDVKFSDTVLDLKRKIWSLENVPVDEQQLYLDNRQLDDHRTLRDCEIDENSQILMSQRGVVLKP